MVVTPVKGEEVHQGRAYFLYWRREQDSNPRTFRLTVFKTAALDHSAIPPALPISCEPAGNGPAGYPFFGKKHITRRRVFCQSLSCKAEGARG